MTHTEEREDLYNEGYEAGLHAALEAVKEEAAEASSGDGRSTNGRRRPGLWLAVATIERLIERAKGDDSG